ncbi:MAG: hypothetical protein HEEMFOPI_00275 [Holosporales bacterium]
MNKNLFYIDINAPYLKTLAKGIVDRFNQQERPHTTLLFPSDRAILNFQSIFIKEHTNQTLPKIYSFSNFFKNNANKHGYFIKSPTSLERFHILFNILKEKLKTPSTDHINTLTNNIISLIDEVFLSSKTLEDLLKTLHQTKNTKHNAALLFECIQGYQSYLLKNNLIDEKEALQKMCQHTTHTLQKGIEHPILLCGTTGSIPFIQDFSKMLISSPNGYVVLPGYDAQNRNIDIYHPFYTQKKWVDDLNCAPPLPFCDMYFNYDFKKIFNNLKSQKTKVDHIIPFELSTPLEEAKLVATIVRDELYKNNSVSIVCNDQALIQCIQDQLTLYAFKANNSLGVSLLKTVAGKFFNLFLNILQNKSLKNIIPFLKHPLYRALNRYDHLKDLGIFEKSLQIESDQMHTMCFKIFKDLSVFKNYSVKSFETGALLIDAFIKDLNILSDSTEFKNQDGIALLAFLEHLKTYFFKKTFPLFSFIDILRSYLDQAPSLTTIDTLHQNVTLIGTIEARHQTTDVVIVTALNEGQWPSVIKPNLWLSPYERQCLSLPEEERRLGLGAHDFLSCLQAKRVYLTRSLKVDGVPLQENRWLKRFKLHFDLTDDAKNIQQSYLSITKQLMIPYKKLVNVNSDKKYPSIKKMPKELSISALELLNQDPYAFYIRYILGIKEKEDWFLNISSAQIGQIAHKILEQTNLLEDSFLKEDIEKILAPYMLDSHQKLFLTKHLYEMVIFVINNIHENPVHHFLREQKLSLNFDDITIFGIADRIDFNMDGSVLRLIDYKTGTPPSFKKIEKGESLQMPILYALCQKTFSLSPSILCEYIQLKGYKNQSKIINLKITDTLCEQTLYYVKALINYYFKENNPLKPLS